MNEETKWNIPADICLLEKNAAGRYYVEIPDDIGLGYGEGKTLEEAYKTAKLRASGELDE